MSSNPNARSVGPLRAWMSGGANTQNSTNDLPQGDEQLQEHAASPTHLRYVYSGPKSTLGSGLTVTVDSDHNATILRLVRRWVGRVWRRFLVLVGLKRV